MLIVFGLALGGSDLFSPQGPVTLRGWALIAALVLFAQGMRAWREGWAEEEVRLQQVELERAREAAMAHVRSDGSGVDMLPVSVPAQRQPRWYLARATASSSKPTRTDMIIGGLLLALAALLGMSALYAVTQVPLLSILSLIGAFLLAAGGLRLCMDGLRG